MDIKEAELKDFFDLVFQELSEIRGFDFLSKKDMKDTPKRVSDVYLHFTSSVGKEFPAEEFTCFPNEGEYDQLISKVNIPIHSLCSHHMLPFFGIAHFGYMPDPTTDSLIVGASKLTRILRFYGKRPQTQEEYCNSVIKRFIELAKPRWCMVIMKCKHACYVCRGALSGDADFVTSAIGGYDRENQDIKKEFLSLCL